MIINALLLRPFALTLGLAALNLACQPNRTASNQPVSIPIASPPSVKASLPCAVPDLNLSKTKQLLDAGAPVDSTGDNCIHMEPSPRGVTLLMLAAGESRVDLVKLLLERGANVNASDSYLRTPIFYAVTAKDTAIIGALIDRGAEINARAESDQTPLMTAAADGNVATIDYLINRGANLNAQNEHRTTALMFAAGFKQPQAMRALLDRGANPQLKDRRGRTYLTYAKRGYPNEYLILRM